MFTYETVHFDPWYNVTRHTYELKARTLEAAKRECTKQNRYSQTIYLYKDGKRVAVRSLYCNKRVWH